MKKLLVHISVSFLCLLILFGFCVFLSFYAQNSVDELIARLDELPPVESFEDAVNDEARYEALLGTAQSLEEQMKKAGDRLAFFINYEYISSASASACALRVAVRAKSLSAFVSSEGKLRETLESMRRLETASFETLL